MVIVKKVKLTQTFKNNIYIICVNCIALKYLYMLDIGK